MFPLHGVDSSTQDFRKPASEMEQEEPEEGGEGCLDMSGRGFGREPDDTLEGNLEAGGRSRRRAILTRVRCPLWGAVCTRGSGGSGLAS